MGLSVVIVTPEKTALDVTADFVVLPLIDGEIGVLPGHAPTIGRMGFGEMRVRTGSTTNSYYVDGGFAQIADDVVSVLTGRALTVDDLDESEVRNRMQEAEHLKPSSLDESEKRRRMIYQSKAQLKMLGKS